MTHWFALSEERPLFWFAGIWRPWTGARKGEEGEHHLDALLTCPPNETVKPIHAKAMPVILTSEDASETWLTGSVEDALDLQQPTSDDLLRIVATGAKSDAVPA